MAKAAKGIVKPAVYVVQTWNVRREMTNSYETTIGSSEELHRLKAFLRSKHAHVVISPKVAR